MSFANYISIIAAIHGSVTRRTELCTGWKFRCALCKTLHRDGSAVLGSVSAAHAVNYTIVSLFSSCSWLFNLRRVVKTENNEKKVSPNAQKS